MPLRLLVYIADPKRILLGFTSGFKKLKKKKLNLVPCVREQTCIIMFFWQFSNINLYVKIVGKMPDQHLIVLLFSNPGDKVLKR